jgi:hypothetical protein
MCEFKDQITDKKVVVGYKLAVKDKYNHYYSPITGVRYKVGKVPAATKYGTHNLRRELKFNDILDKTDPSNKSEYKGMTAVFKYRHAVDSFKWHCLDGVNQHDVIELSKKLVVLEMELSGEIYDGNYYMLFNRPVYIGSEIKSIKKVKK